MQQTLEDIAAPQAALADYDDALDVPPTPDRDRSGEPLETTQNTLWAYAQQLPVDGVTVFDVATTTQRGYVTMPVIGLELVYDGVPIYHAFQTDGGVGKGFADLLAHTADEPRAGQDHGWGAGVADVLAGALDRSPHDITHSHTYRHTGDPQDPMDVTTRTELYDGNEHLLTAETGPALLTAAIADAEMRVDVDLFQQGEALADSLPLGSLELADYQFPDPAPDYTPAERGPDAPTTDWTLEDYVPATLTPHGSRVADVNGVPDRITTGDSPPQFLLTGDDREHTVPFSTIMLSEHAIKRYKQEDDNNRHALRPDAYEELGAGSWRDIVTHLLDEEDHETTPIAALRQVADATIDDPAHPRHGDTLTATEPVEAYLAIEDTTYRVPVHDFQSLAIATDGPIAVVQNYDPGTPSKTYD